jgi:hypothetical protein
MKSFVALCMCLLLSAPAAACLHSSKARALFVRDHPCPANGKKSGTCPGWIVDHIEPLCAGGRDVPENMQWQTIADAKAKDKLERKQCAKKFMKGDVEA